MFLLSRENADAGFLNEKQLLILEHSLASHNVSCYMVHKRPPKLYFTACAGARGIN